MFNLIVTCVGSKKYEGPTIKDALTSLRQKGIRDDVNELFENWKKVIFERIKSSNYLPKVHDVYKGSMWKASIEAFEEINEPKQLWIISCGFGLINSKEKITGYHATFKRGEEDCIYNKYYFPTLGENEAKRQWWNLLIKKGVVKTGYPKSIHELVNNMGSEDVVMVVAGKDYYEAIFDDLSQIKTEEKQLKLAFVGIKKENENYYPAIPTLLQPNIISYSDRSELLEFLKGIFGGCNQIQINPRAAQFVIRRYNKTSKLLYRFP